MREMSHKPVLLGLAIAVGLGGVFFLGLALWYLVSYITDDANNQYRYEYLQGTTLALVYGLPCWLGVSILLFPIRTQLSRAVYVAANVPAAVLGIGFLIMNLYIFIRAAWQ